ncbi:MAG: cobalamin-dependent protein [Bryobacterales bacterium]|nr:cobalamin-dependent protein [Bryobacterales bacterium]
MHRTSREEAVEKAERLQRLAQAVLEMDLEGVGPLVEEALAAGLAPAEILAEGLSAGMRRVGELFKSGEIFMPEVLVSCDVYYRGLEILRPLIRKAGCGATRGKMIIGTIHGDIHSVGKDVAVPVFQAAGYDVIDLGVDVPDEKFVEAIREHEPDIVGLGTYMTSTFMHTRETVRAIAEAGLRDRVRIICGGPAVDPAAARRMGADDASDDAWEAVAKLDRLVEELRSARRSA